MLEAIVAGAAAGYAIAIPVGVIAVLIIHIGIQQGLRAGLAGAAGSATAFGIFAIVAMLAGIAAAELLAGVETPLRLAAGAVLVAIGLRGLLTMRAPEAATAAGLIGSTGLLRTYLLLLVLTLLNPVAIIYFAALVVGLPDLGGPAERSAFIVAVIVSSLSWKSLLAGLGALFGRGSSARRLRRATTIIGSLLILGFGLVVLWQAVTGT